MKSPIFVAALAMGLAAAPTVAAATVYTVAGTGSGSLAGTIFTDSNFVLSFTVDDRSNLPTATYFKVGAGDRVTLNIVTAFGAAFDTFYLQNLSSRFHNDFFDFTLPDPQVDIYAPFAAVTGTNIRALGAFKNIGTSGGDLTLTSSSDVRFEGVRAAVPEPASWALMIGGFMLVGVGMRARARVVTV